MHPANFTLTPPLSSPSSSPSPPLPLPLLPHSHFLPLSSTFIFPPSLLFLHFFLPPSLLFLHLSSLPLSPPGPLSGTSDEEKCNAKDKKAFGSQDVHRHHVIGNLKKVTIALEGGEENGEEEEVELPIGDEESSLDYSSLDRPQQRAPYT